MDLLFSNLTLTYWHRSSSRAY